MQFIIATHGYLANGFVSSIKVLTHKENIYAINAYVEENYDVMDKIKDLLESFPSNERVIIFTDVISGSLTQSVSSFLNQEHIRCITGVNLPLILEFVLTTQEIDDNFICNAVEDAKKQIIYLNSILC